LDGLVPVLLRFLSSNEEGPKVSALQSIVAACLTDGLMQSALVAHFSDYLNGLSALATDPSMLGASPHSIASLLTASWGL
jgi:hypothetical protein